MTDTSPDTILEMRQIAKAFAGVQALKGVSFSCRAGQVHALVGENGAGKSTLMKILAGAYQPDSGEIIYKGRRYTSLSTREALDNGIRIIYQELNLLPYMTVAENIFLGREPRTGLGLIDTKKLYADAEAILQRLEMPLDVRQPVGELTVARQQMVEIAKALSQRADVIVMDEPSAILAGHELETLFSVVESLVRQGVAVIYISHRLDEVFRIANEVTVLKDGQVVGTHPIEALTRAQLIQMMVGRSLDEAFPHGQPRRGAPVLTVEGVTTAAVRDIHLTLHAGEIVGLAGLVGSGRTELARALFGADRLQSGTVWLNGEVVTLSSPAQAVDAGIALVPEDRKTQGLFMELPIRNNITLTVLDKLTRYGVIRRRAEAERVDQARRELAIAMASASAEVQYLSGGNQQKVVLSKWLARAPKVIILDEPTRGIDVGAKFEIYQLMRQLTEQGVAILMISSELTEILGMSDRILVMRDGRIVGELAREEATEERVMQLATTGSLLPATTELPGYTGSDA
ncbi:MAG: sugar ABC transporter ATP-binding protein [Chloroflexota bacterium]